MHRIMIDATCVENVYCGYRVYVENILPPLFTLLKKHNYDIAVMRQRCLDENAPLVKLIKQYDVKDILVDLPVMGLKRILLQPKLKTLSDHNKDLADEMDLYLCLHSTPLTGLAATRKIAVLHDLSALTNMSYFRRLRSLKRGWLKFEYKHLLSRMDKVVAVSGSTRKDALNLLGLEPDKVEVAHEASVKFTDIATEAPEILKGKQYFLSLGARPHKNIPRLLKSFCEFSEKFPDFTLVLVGDCDAEKNEIIKRYHPDLADRIVVLKNVDNKLLGRLYSECFALVYVSLYEGFGLPILEAMQFGKPVITSNVSSMPEVAGEAALIVDPYSCEEITDAISSLLTDRKLYADLAQRSERRSLDFSWDISAEKLFSQIVNT